MFLVRKYMRINTKTGLAPVVALIIALIAVGVVGGGAVVIKKNADKKAEKKEVARQEQVEKEQKEKEEADIAAKTLQVKLNEQSTSGQGGQAVIVQVGTSTIRVIVNLAGKPSGVPQPAHIHLGTCPNPGAVKYPLTNVDKGASQTDIPNMTIEQLLSELPLAINVHKSATEASVYVACGNIEKKTDYGHAKENKATTTDSQMESKKETRVTYNSQGFSPKTVTIKKGETVVFENKTGKNASVASDAHPTHLIYPEFDQYKTDQRGKDEFRFTFTKVGTWGYHDHLNASQGGTVIVE